jgi:hypothetical protein
MVTKKVTREEPPQRKNSALLAAKQQPNQRSTNDRTRRRLVTVPVHLAFHPAYKPKELGDRNKFDLERGLRSVAFLMDSLSEGGNRELNGVVAQGLANILLQYGDYLGWTEGRRNDYDGPIIG